MPAPPPEAHSVPIVLLTDLSSGQVLYARNADRRFIPASITKVMTLFTAFEMIDGGKLKPQQVLTYRTESFAEWRRKGSTMFLEQDARVSVDQQIGRAHVLTTVTNAQIVCRLQLEKQKNTTTTT